jgi:CBS domain-containing protein
MTEIRKVARAAVLVSPDVPVSKVVRLMVKYAVGAVVVADSDGSIHGIFTERDNLVRVTNPGLEPSKTPVRDVMTTSVKTARPNMPIDDALQLMTRRRFRHLPITDSTHRVTGIVSMRYLLMQRMSEQHESLEVLEAYVHAGGPG